MEEEVGYIYFIKSNISDSYIKIGKAKDYIKRIQTINCYVPLGVSTLGVIKTNLFYSDIELFFHKYFKDKLINNEWFAITFEEIIICINQELRNVLSDLIIKKIGTMSVLNRKTGKTEDIAPPGVDRFYNIQRKRDSFEWNINIKIPISRNRIFFYEKD